MYKNKLSESENKEIFNKLRGYYSSHRFHPSGQKEGLTLKDLLSSIGFETFKDFCVWYDSLDMIKREKWKLEWCCKGHCCQSILLTLVKLKNERLCKLVKSYKLAYMANNVNKIKFPKLTSLSPEAMVDITDNLMKKYPKTHIEKIIVIAEKELNENEQKNSK